MSGTLAPRVVLVTREDDYDLLLARHATRGQAEFFLRSRRQSVAAPAARHDALGAALATVRAGVPRGWRIAQVRRDGLDSFLFGPEDVVVPVGQDGLVANVAKYLRGQPVIGVNPEPGRNPGVLAPHPPEAVAGLLVPVSAGQVATEDRTMLRAELDTGQAILALNEVFIGHASHQSARYVLEHAGQKEQQSSSGLIVTTGTGATGWALSIGRATGQEVRLAPTERAAAFLVREAWPSPATGAEVTFGRLDGAGRLRVVSRMNEGGTVFADGIERDRLQFDYGAEVSVGVDARVLRLVPPATRALAARPNRRGPEGRAPTGRG